MDLPSEYPPSRAGRNAARVVSVASILKYDATRRDSYVYDTLAERDSIRLLRIQPADKLDAALHLSITHTTLSTITPSDEDRFKFIALSYCWGPQVFREPVYIEGAGDEAVRTRPALIEDYAKQRNEHLTEILHEASEDEFSAWVDEAE